MAALAALRQALARRQVPAATVWCRPLSVAAGGLQTIVDSDRQELASLTQPVVLHCGAAWLERSRQVAARLAEWASDAGPSAPVLCASADLQAAPKLIRERHITSFPSVLLLRGGKVERRADGADLAALEAILKEAAACSQSSAASSAEELSPRQKVALAEELEERGAKPSEAASWYRQVLEDSSPLAAPFAFRARLGLLRCHLASTSSSDIGSASAQEAASLLEALWELHEGELQAVSSDGVKVGSFVAHAGLFVDHLQGSATGEEAEILRLYAEKNFKEAVDAALTWYQRTAGRDLEGLIESYCLPERRVSDRRGCVPSKSIFRRPALELDLDTAPGPAEPRAMLRRLFEALGHDSPVVARARAELEFLLDRKPFVRFHTRRTHVRKGGPPLAGRGTGKRSGYSRRYWIMWGPERVIINNRRMNSPHCDKND